jgi:hypothetical protein
MTYLLVEPLKNKTAKDVVKALKYILNKCRKCKKLRSDNGKEFNNNIMKTFLKNEGTNMLDTSARSISN